MIPLRLQLRNFMCYRELDSLDFSGIHLACLAGDNGHGKSALLDAITWALWGKARAKHDDELIYLGQTEMEVEFEFALGDNHYRVIRKRDSHGRGQSSLELQVRDGDLFRPLTEPTMRETQARINGILRMDYETFINSAFLLQGRADEFTVKPPGERKRILGEILGLSLYDQYEERAKERAKARESEVEQIAAQIREMERELERKPEYEEELKQTLAAVEGLSSTLRGAEEELRKLREQWKELDLKRTQIEELSAQMARGEQELAEIGEQMAACQERLAEYEAVISERKFIEKGFASLAAARQLHESLNEKLAQLVKLNERKGQLEATIAEARHALTLEQRLCSEKVKELSALAQELEVLEVELSRVQTELGHLVQREIEREAKQQQIGELSNERASLNTRNEQLKGEIDSLKEKSGLLQAAEAHCPLCGQELSEEDRVRLEEQFTSEMAESDVLYQANQAQIEELAAWSRALEQEIEDLGRELATKVPLQKQEATLEKSLAEAKGAAEELVKQREKLAELDERLTSEKYAEAEQAELAELLGQIEGLGYDREAHQEVRRDLEVLSRFEEDKARLKAALDRVDEQRASLERLRKNQARWQETLAADRAKKEALAQEVAQLPELTTRLERKSKEVDELRGKEARARQVLGAARQKLDYCEYLTKERDKKLKERRQVAEEKAIYDELRLAFGKKGLQAMIIESAIPEIEDEANRLLARMTDGRMHVRFETQRETLKGDTVETLAINISDELGPRSYELYSGGESFRVNFAIRIALSKLLARRAGARLQTLVIDEGFGTQDTQGRERLVEAINSIQEDFEKILVITHIEELKDAFPVRIDVFKTPQGSQVAIN
ncbi:MAG: SMC family ATPase [Anaerolineae bacterium]